MVKNLNKPILALLCSAVLLTGCDSTTEAESQQLKAQPSKKTSFKLGSGPNYVPANPYLADSVAPIGHINSGQSTGMAHAGPAGPSEELSIENGGLTYTHLGPGHFGYAISPPYPNGKRVVWSNGADRISKLDYDTLEVIDE